MSLAERLLERFWQSPWRVVREPVETIARDQAVDVYLVGGHVRDLLLGRQASDCDLTIEGDGLAFAAALADRTTGRLHQSARFLTAEVGLPGGRRVDVTTARREAYPKPGALPVVEPADIRTDLRRRDFRINTFALRVAGSTTPELLSEEGAADDLEAGWLRILHAGSFVDDPTRILRAVRLERQLGFAMDPETVAGATLAIGDGALDTISSVRLWSDLEPLLLDQGSVAPSLARLDELGALSALVDGLRWSGAQERRWQDALIQLERLGSEAPDPELPAAELSVTLLSLASPPEEYLGLALAKRLTPPKGVRSDLDSWPDLAEAAERAIGSPDARPSAVHEALQKLALSQLAFLAASLEGPALDWVHRETSELRRVELAVRAADLIARGHPPGPAIGQALEAVRVARLDGEIGTESELDYALAVLNEIGAPPEEPG